MRMWPISTLVDKPQNDDLWIVEPIELSAVRPALGSDRSPAVGHLPRLIPSL
jgi:hypothetical protein